MVSEVVTDIVLDHGRGSGSSTRATVLDQVTRLAKSRLKKYPPNKKMEVALFPVGIMFATKSASPKLQDSIDFWHRDSGRYFDLVFPAWYRRYGELRFSEKRFVDYKDEVQQVSDYRYSGETDLLILNFEYFLEYGRGAFAFDQVIDIKVDSLIKDNGVNSLNGLITEVTNAAKDVYTNTGDTGIWEISDRIGSIRTEAGLFNMLVKKIDKYVAGTFGKLIPFSVRDYSKR